MFGVTFVVYTSFAITDKFKTYYFYFTFFGGDCIG